MNNPKNSLATLAEVFAAYPKTFLGVPPEDFRNEAMVWAYGIVVGWGDELEDISDMLDWSQEQIDLHLFLRAQFVRFQQQIDAEVASELADGQQLD